MKEKKKTKKFNKKYLAFGILGLFALALVSALTCYALFSVTLNVNQPIGITYDGNLEQSVDCGAGQTCLGSAIEVSNSGDEDKSVFVTDNSGENIVVSYVGKMIFTGKDLVTGDLSGTTKEIVYTITGEEFVATGIPDGYSLIYYPDMDGGFPVNVENILVYGEETFPSLPVLEDIGDDYCNIRTGDDSELANPDALVCNGAKLWLVEDEYVNALKLGNWAPNSILFETDLITYTVSSTGEVLVPVDSTITFYPEYFVNEYLPGGSYNVEITIA